MDCLTWGADQIAVFLPSGEPFQYLFTCHCTNKTPSWEISRIKFYYCLVYSDVFVLWNVNVFHSKIWVSYRCNLKGPCQGLKNLLCLPVSSVGNLTRTHSPLWYLIIWDLRSYCFLYCCHAHCIRGGGIGPADPAYIGPKFETTTHNNYLCLWNVYT